MEFIIDDQTLRPIRNEVEVLNGDAYRDAVLKPRIKPLLEAKTVQGLLDVLEPVKLSLETFGTKPKFNFKSPKSGSPDAAVLPLRTVVDLTDCRPSNATQLQAKAIRDRYSLGGVWLLSNKLGLGEVIDISARFQPKPYSLAAGSASIESPTPVGRGLLKLTGFFFNEDRVWSSYAIASHGLSAELKVPWIANVLFKGGLHAIARNVHSINEGASDTIRAAAGSSSLKVSAMAELSHKGAFHFASALIEAAGKPGDSQFIKSSGELDAKLPLTPGRELEVEFNGRAGYIHSDDDRPKLCDNFLIGGPGSILGFKPHSVGPRDGSDFTGGQAFYTTRVALLSKLPLKPMSPLRFKTQVDTGVLRSNASADLQSNIRDLINSPVVFSTSAGLTYRTEKANFDVLYVLMSRGGDADAQVNGLHIGAELNLF